MTSKSKNIRILITPTEEDLNSTVRTACDPRSCLFNLSFVRALKRSFPRTIMTKPWVDAGHHRVTWRNADGSGYRYAADTPRWVKNALIALDRWDRRGRKKGEPCPIKMGTLKPYAIILRRLYKVTPYTKAQKEAAYARVQKQREAGYRRPHRRSMHDRVVGYA